MLGGGSICAFRDPQTYPSLGKKETGFEKREPLVISFDLRKKTLPLSRINVDGEFKCSMDRARPSSTELSQDCLTLRLKNQQRMITLPCRIGLKYDKGLQFASLEDSFWIDIHRINEKSVEADVCFLDADGTKGESSFSLPIEEAPLKESVDLPEESPLRILCDARLVGRDLLSKKYLEGTPPQRIEVKMGTGTRVLEVREHSLLVWKETGWEVMDSLDANVVPILARVSSLDEKKVFFDAWILDEYIRFSVSSSKPQLCKTKVDEFLSAVRIRSEKQISCMLEKQCFVLRTGDWVFKENQRWRILRKKEQRDAYLQGKLLGELFIFDGIEMKGGQKTLQGQLLNIEHSQSIPVEVVAGVNGKNKTTPPSRKGK